MHSFPPQIQKFNCSKSVNKALEIITNQFASLILSYLQTHDKSTTLGLNELCKELENFGFNEISNQTRMEMNRMRIQKKDKAFNNLIHFERVSQNEHLKFTQAIFNSKYPDENKQ